MILILVDVHSKYIEAHVMKSSTTVATLIKLRQTFATHGIPVVIVSYNGTAFTNQEFNTFCDVNGIKHTCSSPYHPSTNGLAERAVQTITDHKRRFKETQRGRFGNKTLQDSSKI